VLDCLQSHGSCHPVKATAFCQDGEFFLFPVDSNPSMGDLLPSLHGHYSVSSLLWSSPSLVGASVHSASRDLRLCLFP